MTFTVGGFKIKGSKVSPSPILAVSVSGTGLLAGARLEPRSMAAAVDTEDHFLSKNLFFIDRGMSRLAILANRLIERNRSFLPEFALIEFGQIEGELFTFRRRWPFYRGRFGSLRF